MKAEELQDVQRFLDSTANAIELNMFNDLIIDLGLIALQLFYALCSSPAGKSFHSSWSHGLIIRSTRPKARADHTRTP